MKFIVTTFFTNYDWIVEDRREDNTFFELTNTLI